MGHGCAFSVQQQTMRLIQLHEQKDLHCFVSKNIKKKQTNFQNFNEKSFQDSEITTRLLCIVQQWKTTFNLHKSMVSKKVKARIFSMFFFLNSI